jgi:hypothetical protein
MQAARENDNPTVEDELLQDEEIAEVVEDDGAEPMDDDDDMDDGMGDDETMEIGEDQLEDNSIGASCKLPLRKADDSRARGRKVDLRAARAPRVPEPAARRVRRRRRRGVHLRAAARGVGGGDQRR